VFRRRIRIAVVALVGAGAGCGAPTLDEMDNVYSHGAERPVVCAMNIDDKNQIGEAELGQALDRARGDGTILHVYAHRPGDTLDVRSLEELLAGAVSRGLPFVTYRELLVGVTGGGLALSFDDHNLEAWTATEPLFARYDARVTLFISSYHVFLDSERTMLRALEAEGHDIEYHSTHHDDARSYTADHGIQAYLDEDIAPDLEAMRADGYDPKVFAYPFGDRTDATDAALLAVFPLLRASHAMCPN
jgi:hypothetical protein